MPDLDRLPHTGDVDGLFRSNATERDRVRRQLVGITTVAGLSACAAVGGLLVGLVPADAGQRSGGDQQQATTQQQQSTPPVATSGGS
jgi:hypothetical protein